MYKITVYTAPGCPYCVKVKSYLRELGLKFTEVDVSKSQKDAEKLVRRTGQTGVPVVEIGNQLVIGFDRARIDKLLGVR
ncbi:MULTISPECIES: glutaredoxin family protein [Pseudothermotoga]|jgi:glutaredoxin-like YruB-family protein|uniref:Glutaredoxin-like protein, YruB-family n=1 Tax=Pseudothermotoga lettingae (strain ATCC BAA-301 / DSM 14385 / NBRC 107922 / TMO) TaxID=416591 RepID=A8F5X6_PSELT|nr:MULTISPECIES: glutaredoxin domain-containing protein [Pseudothermotoga]ABV33560.1 glutaredoxin-like protein, YruB-family [Pseudothermotoga lettingae TMO]KUK20784.1 MAG: Glutaredoxin-like protein, YruB-family [Pseudothermotoga lettingae]MDI3495563.1 glutaredoxin 3 [Pseudothermotoga sp.]MDK2883792.1 glutaredoxin 3 [Pseudothermotoga sp.]GLI49526.1 NrdH-redoxin [Pseudothermotoga lettingae TMO]